MLCKSNRIEFGTWNAHSISYLLSQVIIQSVDHESGLREETHSVGPQ